MPHASPRSQLASRPRGARFFVPWLALLVVALLLLAGRWSPTQAEPVKEPKVELAYMSITGAGSTARAWYEGAPSPGVPVQDAFDFFASKGFEIVRTTDSLLNVSTRDQVAFAVLLQKVR